jgi:TonB family protein
MMLAASRVITVVCILCFALSLTTIAQEEAPPSHASFGAWSPVVLKRVYPVYPDKCKKAGVEGTGIFEILINKEGVPEKIKILRGLDTLCEGLDAAAIEALEQWRFEPSFDPRKPLPRPREPESVLMTLTMKFKLDEMSSRADGFRRISLESANRLQITADLYAPHQDPATPFIVLFHQAGWSRGEYREIAPRLNRLGFNCLAVDARSGDEINGVVNESAQRARDRSLGGAYLDALPDLEAALARVRTDYPGARLIAWGSSYSASLALRIAGEKPGLVDAVLAFSPGEYFAKEGKPGTWVRDAAAKITVPVFITSARREEPNWAPIYAAIPEGKKSSYLPETDGNHGSRALWKEFDDSKGYWHAVAEFLAPLAQK